MIYNPSKGESTTVDDFLVSTRSIRRGSSGARTDPKGGVELVTCTGDGEEEVQVAIPDFDKMTTGE
jgi:hypothetical protein